MPTAQRRSGANKPATKPTPDPDLKPAKPTELDRAQAAWEKANAKAEKSKAKVTDLEKKLADANAVWRSDQRTADYLFMHPALAEAREAADDTRGTLPAADIRSLSVSTISPNPASGRIFTEDNGEAIGVAPPVDDAVAEGEIRADIAAQDKEWEAAAPEIPRPPVTIVSPAPEPAPEPDVTDPFAAGPEPATGDLSNPVDPFEAEPPRSFNPLNPFGDSMPSSQF